MQRNYETQVFDVNKKTHTIQMSIEGCLVTAVCEPEPNPDIYDRLRDILMDSVLHNGTELGREGEIPAF